MTVTKDTTHILTNPQEFQAAYLRAVDHFAKNPNVVSVGFGQKNTGGNYRESLAIVVYVREKKSEDELDPAERIPSSFEGYPTDVVKILPSTPAVIENTGEYSPIRGGIQIAPKQTGTGTGVDVGTLSCIVHSRGDSNRENAFLLTCWHVLFTESATAAGDYVYHPYPPPHKPSNALGPIENGAIYANKPYKHVINGITMTSTHFLDAGVARINLDSVCCEGSTCTQDTTQVAASIIDLGLDPTNTVADVRNLMLDPTIWSGGAPVFQPFKVFKVGRTTGKTAGLVRVVNGASFAPADPRIPVPPGTPTPMVEAKGLIIIDFDPTDPSSQPNGLNGKQQAWFADHGDSGSLVVDAQRRAIGIVSTVGFPQLPNNGGPNPAVNAPAYVCHILPILDHLNICISSAGPSPGSSAATDGTGRLPVATPLPAQSTLPTGQIVFTSPDAATSPIGFNGGRPPRRISEDEVRHMHELRARFLSTRVGPELYETFREVRREIGFLVRNSRPVKVAWNRLKGPAYFAHVLNHLGGQTESVPHEVQGVTRRALLLRMREVLTARGSKPLRQALERYGDELLELFTREDCDNVEDCMALLEARQLA